MILFTTILYLVIVRLTIVFCKILIKCCLSAVNSVKYYKKHRKGKFIMYRIRDLREDRDLSQSEIAKVIKTTQQQYSKIENGISDISGEKLILLAEFYNVSADYILGISDDKRRK